MSHPSSVLWPPPTSHPASSWISPPRLIPFVTSALCLRPDETSPVPSFTVTTSRSPYTGEFFAAAFPGSSPLLLPSLLAHKLGSLFFPFGLTCRRCKIHFMLRAAALRPFPRGLQRFSTSGHPDALVACYLAACPLPGLDFHQQANDDFSGHTSRCWAGEAQWVRERGFLSLPVVAIGSIPYIILACGFPAPGDPRCLAHIREHSLTLCQLTTKGYQPDMGQISIRPASVIAFADVFEFH